MIRDALVLALIVALTVAARSFLPPGSIGAWSPGAALGFGFVLLAAIQTGSIFHALRLPHLTGFILTGAIVGPEILGFLDTGSVEALGTIKQVAVGFIGLLAGCELNVRALRSRLKTISLFALCGLVGAFCLLFVLFLVLLSFVPATRDLDGQHRAMVALLCANALAAFSPPVVIGVINEARARGPVADLCVPLVVLADLVIVITYSFSNAAGHAMFPSPGDTSGLFGLATHIFGSIGFGLAFGAILALYITRVKSRIALFVFGALFVIAEAGGALHLDPLLVGLAAGLFLENISPVSGHEVAHETESAAHPTFVVFFATVGAELHVHAFLSVVGYSIAAAAVRATGIFGGARIASSLARAEPVVRKSIGFTMLPQAGIALALATSIKSGFKPWGDAVGTILLGTVVVNEVLGPVLFRLALARAGEIPAEDEAAEATA